MNALIKASDILNASIQIVDDEELNLIELERTLGSNGYIHLNLEQVMLVIGPELSHFGIPKRI